MLTKMGKCHNRITMGFFVFTLHERIIVTVLELVNKPDFEEV
jgi:hypothetical protein